MEELHRMSPYEFEEQMVLSYNSIQYGRKNSRISTRTKLHIFRNNVKWVLSYGSETRKERKTTTSKLQTFVNCCLRRILNIHWPKWFKMKNFREGQRKSRCPCRSRDGNGTGYDIRWGKDMKPSKEKPQIGTHKGKGGGGDLDIHGEELSTMWH